MSPCVLDAPVKEPAYDAVTAALVEKGWGVFPNFIGADEVAAIREECQALRRMGGFRHAGVGTGAGLKVRPEIRTDQVLWLDPSLATPAQARWLGHIERLRQAINRDLYLGLFEWEGHFAVYPPGSYYKRHLDQFQGIGLRTVTAILYLNDGWQPEDGGQLRLYLDKGDDSPYLDVLPEAGTLVSFLSAEYLHEVLPARRDRMAVTGWYRRRE